MKKLIITLLVSLLAVPAFATSFCKGSIHSGYGDCIVRTNSENVATIKPGQSRWWKFYCPSNHPYFYRIENKSDSSGTSTYNLGIAKHSLAIGFSNLSPKHSSRIGIEYSCVKGNPHAPQWSWVG